MKVLLAIIFLAPAFAGAAVKLECPAVDDFSNENMTCEENGKFGQAGVDCLSSLETAIKNQSAVAHKAMMGSNEKLVDKAGNAQTHNFHGSGADYALAQATLEELIASAKKAREKVESYHLNIFYPEDFDAPEEVIGDREEFIMDNPCFSENKLGLMDIVKKIDKDIADLEKTKALAMSKGATSGTRQEGMQNSLVNGASNTKAAGAKAGAIPKGTSQNGSSDITGVKEDQSKQQKK
jgi:hypothetical protein